MLLFLFGPSDTAGSQQFPLVLQKQQCHSFSSYVKHNSITAVFSVVSNAIVSQQFLLQFQTQYFPSDISNTEVLQQFPPEVTNIAVCLMFQTQPYPRSFPWSFKYDSFPPGGSNSRIAEVSRFKYSTIAAVSPLMFQTKPYCCSFFYFWSFRNNSIPSVSSGPSYITVSS